jgi:thiol:disulfide interchange protein
MFDSRENQSMKARKILRKALVAAILLLGLSNYSASAKEIEWQSFSDGMARGKFEKKMVFLHFYAEWCAACMTMQEKTFKDPGVIAFLNANFIPIKVDVDQEKQTSALFKVQALPDSWFITENTDIIGHRPGFIAPEQLKTLLEMIMQEHAEP